MKFTNSGEEFVFKPDFRGKFLSYGVEVYHRGLVDSFEVLREGIGLVYRDSLGGVSYFDYSKFGGIEEGGCKFFLPQSFNRYFTNFIRF